MESRKKYLCQLRDFIREADEKVSMILLNLQWDKNKLIQADSLVTCKFDKNHRIPLQKQKEHEEKCYLKCRGYWSDDLFLPEPLEPNAKTVVKFTTDEIKDILDTASKDKPYLERGKRPLVSHPLTLDRLTTTFTRDERKVIHDAVVDTMPSFHDLSDLALPRSGPSENRPMTRLEVLAELRDVRRRRARYRGAAPDNYCAALRGLIAVQMEVLTASNTEIERDDQSADTKSRSETHRREDKHTRSIDRYTRGSDREHYRARENQDRSRYKDRRYSDDSDSSRSSYSTARGRRYSRYDGRDRRDTRSRSRSEDCTRRYSSRDRERRSRDRRYRGRDHRDRK